MELSDRNGKQAAFATRNGARRFIIVFFCKKALFPLDTESILADTLSEE
ncbi:hypothetical protein [Neobacillus notoginsengisoli]|nr:hypothetical protein [Neobacillus notoginsengisoli]